MKNLRKKGLALMLALALVLGAFNGVAVSAKTSLKKDTMAEVLEKVKTKLGIGNEFDEFTYNFSEDVNENAWWSFDWSMKDGSKYAYAVADKSGHVYSYVVNSNIIGNNELLIPAYTREELIPSVLEWVNKAEPETTGKLKYSSASYSRYDGTYSIGFIRTENGIDMPDNGVRVRVSSVDGTVSAFSANWEYKVKLTAPENLISEETAKEKLGTKLGMDLEYRLGWDEEGNAKVFLAYSPDRSYLAVNAKSGKLYTSKNYSAAEWADEEKEMTAADNAAMAVDGGRGLSDVELARIDEIDGIISSDEAVELILNNPYLYSEDVSYATQAQLYQNDDGYFWNIYLNDERPYDYDNDDYSKVSWYRSSISASIDAKTGEILSYYASVRDLYDYSEEELATLKINYTKKQCIKNFEEFVNSQNAGRLAETKRSDMSKAFPIAYDEKTNKYSYSGYSMNYVRMHENIPFSANSISGSVEGITGRVASYNVNWSEVEFPSSADIISEKDAFNAFIGFSNFDKVYELVTVYSEDYSKKTTKSRLVYRVNAGYSDYVDAVSGKHVNYSGQEYAEPAGDYAYTDIEGSKYERTIRLLADMGIGFEGSEFKPEQVITVNEFNNLLSGTRYYWYSSDEKELSDDELTRENAAAQIISFYGLETLAAMDIFKTGFDDEASISADRLGAVALVKGMKFMKAAKGNSFKPAQKVTRGEAAEIIMNVMIYSGDY